MPCRERSPATACGRARSPRRHHVGPQAPTLRPGSRRRQRRPWPTASPDEEESWTSSRTATGGASRAGGAGRRHRRRHRRAGAARVRDEARLDPRGRGRRGRGAARRVRRGRRPRGAAAPGPAGYDAVVVGGPMIMGWHKDARKYLKRHRDQLGARAVRALRHRRVAHRGRRRRRPGHAHRQGPLAGEEAAERGQAEPQGALRPAAPLRRATSSRSARRRGRAARPCSPARST